MSPRDSRANAILETLMFTPLALLLLFVGMDSAILMGTRGTVRSALRDGLNVEQLLTKDKEIVTSILSDPIINQEQATLLLQAIVQKVHQNIVGVSFLTCAADKYKIIGKLYALEIDRQSGVLIGAYTVGPEEVAPLGAGFEISAELPSFRFNSLQQLEELTLSSNSGAHRLAQPVVLSSDVAQQFYPLTLAIGVEVTAVTSGIAPGITHWLLGSHFGVGEATIVPFRMGLS